MARITIVGSLNMDLVALSPELPGPGETLLGSRHFTAFGGKGANQACAVARLGGDVAMVGRVGNDHYGEAMRANLESAGCNVTGVRTVDTPSGVALIFVADSGQNMIVVAPGANHVFSSAELKRDAALLAETEYVLLQLESPMETVIEAARLAKRGGATVILDPAPALPSLPDELLEHVDILTPNEPETAILTGLPPGPFFGEKALAAAAMLQGRGVGIIVIKLGANGCLLAEGNEVTHIAAPDVEAVDSTAAGDVFNAAMTVALAEGNAFADACRFAVSAATLSVTRFGAQSSMPTRDEVDAFCGSPRASNQEA